MATRANPEKKVDMPPRGDRNADPITNAPGSHPIETGIGAAAVGAASGMAVGAVTGPVGAAIGAAVGAVAGGYAGKGVGEMIDPTTEDNWLRDNFSSRQYVTKGETFDTYQPAYRYGGEAEYRYGDDDFETIEPELEHRWTTTGKNMPMPWVKARSAVKDAYDRTVQLRRSRPCPDECDEVQED
jgi:Glycine zipper